MNTIAPATFRSLFSDNLQPIATRGTKAGGRLLVDQHCGSGCSINRTPLSHWAINSIRHTCVH